MLDQTTFMIPVAYDSDDRMENLFTVTRWIRSRFPEASILQRVVPYSWTFHRTKLLNDMARESTTPVIAITDTDCIIEPAENLLEAQNLIISGKADFVWPFDSLNFCIPHGGTFQDARTRGTQAPAGGVVLCSREAYWRAGGENENFIAWAPEDLERRHRWEKLGFRLQTLAGKIYHYDHYVGPNSSREHAHWKHNAEEWAKVQRMTREELQEYISTWTWKI